MRSEGGAAHGLDGKVAVITGATQGLGEGAARLFAERGAAGLVIAGRNAERGEAVAADITAAGCPTTFVQVDLATADGPPAVIDTAIERFDRVDVVVNCGGSSHRGTLEDTTPEVFDMLFHVNARAPFLIIQRAVETMRERRIEGSIVTVISQASHISWPDLIAYGASKAAMVNMTKTLAVVLSRERIRINGLNIGWTHTPGEDAVRKQFYGDTDGSWIEAANAGQPFGRLIRVEEVARALAFIASPESGLMTGSVVDFDQTVYGMSANPAG
jgi:NAD(P)-dependent dehydrogenase (short-subunit alcohol dehydrogenase family)